MLTAAVGIAITAVTVTAIVIATNTATATTARPTLTSSGAIGAQLYPELCRENRCAPSRHDVKPASNRLSGCVKPQGDFAPTLRFVPPAFTRYPQFGRKCLCES